MTSPQDEVIGHCSKKGESLQSSPLLSVIVPLLNEAEAVAAFFCMLAQQVGIAFEVVVVDGGSTDGTIPRLQHLAAQAPFTSRLLHSDPGRAVQMNLGAAAASGEWLLFLHVDSHLPDLRALADGVAALAAIHKERRHRRIAGRFALSFQGSPKNARFFAFHEAKARFNLPGCIHGDQGFLLHRDFFAEVGPFDPILPFLEDDRLSDKIFAVGEWRLLPAQIVTSARRFEVEGFLERRTLNAILLTLHAIGRYDLLKQLPQVYRLHQGLCRLELRAIFLGLLRTVRRSPSGDHRRLWQAAGCYLWANRWQVVLWLRCLVKRRTRRL